ncbi:nucleolar pre-ribosomal-associated protein 1-like isoform X2 [Vidua chalybeata]|uniref:nucleolar pre-ribosomal-associated protein 1-like isoform X2 n=1 Tax=Vidua chalybeata TaxID=81927 RepID=UPI0023A860F5|nr:nucleolar pre-ribosomal-associated protein 1-like isoform X2 [Vidua chalybeata]
MGWFPGVLILTSPKPQASLPGPLPLPYLLDAVQNGIRQPSLRFAFSLTLCAARVAQQILKPEEHVYIRVKRFLLSHRYLDLRKVPGFLQLFYSFDFERTRSCAVYAL